MITISNNKTTFDYKFLAELFAFCVGVFAFHWSINIIMGEFMEESKKKTNKNLKKNLFAVFKLTIW